tara:strand:- start:260 stop:397 length:138 start_codon:yes stop_codon:yes gene_type:complete
MLMPFSSFSPENYVINAHMLQVRKLGIFLSHKKQAALLSAACSKI